MSTQWAFEQIEHNRLKDQSKLALEFAKVVLQETQLVEPKDIVKKKKKEYRQRTKLLVNDFDLAQIQKPSKRQFISEEELLLGCTGTDIKTDEERKRESPDVEMASASPPKKELGQEEIFQWKPLTPKSKSRVGIDTNVVKDKLLKILNPKTAGNRPSFQDERKSYCTEDLLQKNLMTPLLSLA